jgi:hypothetical protein
MPKDIVQRSQLQHNFNAKLRAILLPVSRSLDRVKVFVLLAITIWIAHFWHSASFGLYADDYIFISQPMISGPRLWSFIQTNVLSFAFGRPIGYILFGIPSFLGAKLGGLKGIYWIAYVFATINSLLFYALLKRLSSHQVFALTGALAFALFPADTTRAWLNCLPNQPSLTFLLIAFHFYLSGRRKWSYLIILGSLLSYETAFPVFLAAPLLKKKWDSKLMQELIGHALVLGIMIVCIVIIRKVLGETRITDLNLLTMIRRSIYHVIEGPPTSMAMFLYRPLTTSASLNGEVVLLMSLCFAGLTWVLSRLNLNTAANAPRLMPSVEGKGFRLENPSFFWDLAKLALLGLVMLVLAYPLTLTVPATVIADRGTRVHLAAVVGASILCACACLAIHFIAGRYRKENLAAVGLAVFFALLVGFGLTVQQDYKISWQYQRQFWTDLVHLCPDITNDTVILVEPTGLQNPKYMVAHNWAMSFVLQQIFQFRPNYQFFDDLKLKPLVYMLLPRWQEKIVSKGELFELNKFTVRSLPVIYDMVESSNVIFLETANGKLTRRTDPLIIGGQEFPLKKNIGSEQPIDKGHLYTYLIKSPNEQRIHYLKTTFN